MKPKVAEPFTHIAISLSGGGYRATAYHLGTLSYLDSLEYRDENMLRRVKVMSTISGGTLTGVMYALYAATGRSFDDCFKKLYMLLREDKLVERALEILSGKRKWRDDRKSRDFINAMSEVYDEFFYEEAHFSALFEGKRSHLTDVSFGATEFTNGLQFRFQQNHGNGRFGNGRMYLPDNVAADVRLADAAAASSCFPGGFEPMIMAKDFASGSQSPIARQWSERGYQTTGLMDGGVIDNQGIEGVQLAERRHSASSETPYVGTYIVSDVSERTMTPYEVPTVEESSLKDFITLRNINLVAAIAIAAILMVLVSQPVSELATVVLSCALTLAVAWLIAYFCLKSYFLRAVRNLLGPDNTRRLLDDFSTILRTPTYILAYLLKLRVTSVTKMVSEVFMKRIRSLQLTALYSNEEWRYRIKANNIYTLLRSKVTDKFPLSSEIASFVSDANSMPTTLWFTDKQRADNMLDKLIVCGQLTTCVNLMRYIDDLQLGSNQKKVWDELDEATQGDIRRLRDKMHQDFERFNQTPTWLLEQHMAEAVQTDA